jgi:hypothetical protein
VALEKDQARILSETVKKLGPTDQQLLLAYSESLKVIRDDVTQILTKIEKKIPLTYAEVAKFNRLENLEKSITSEMSKLGLKTKAIIRKSAGTAYTDSWLRHQFSLENEIGIKLNFGKLNPDFVKSRINIPLSGENFSQTIGRVTNEAASKIKRSVTQALIQGKSIVDIREAITENLNGNARRALTVARTETLRAMSQGHLDAFDRAEDLGVKQRKIWIATMDARTRPDHFAMDGIAANDEGIFTFPDGVQTEAPHLSGAAHQDINCRCDFLVEIVDLPADVEQRVQTGGGGLVKFDSFDKWKAYRVDKFKNAAPPKPKVKPPVVKPKPTPKPKPVTPKATPKPKPKPKKIDLDKVKPIKKPAKVKSVKPKVETPVPTALPFDVGKLELSSIAKVREYAKNSTAAKKIVIGGKSEMTKQQLETAIKSLEKYREAYGTRKIDEIKFGANSSSMKKRSYSFKPEDIIESKMDIAAQADELLSYRGTISELESMMIEKRNYANSVQGMIDKGTLPNRYSKSYAQKIVDLVNRQVNEIDQVVTFKKTGKFKFGKIPHSSVIVKNAHIATVNHEFGHHLHAIKINEIAKYLAGKNKGLYEKRLIGAIHSSKSDTLSFSEYAVLNKKYGVTDRAKDNIRELIAENFALYAEGYGDSIHPDMKKLFDEVLRI